ncbi:glycosyltransferase, partial [Streptococcus suis]|nr:glycosyltransferase [Streptococcus suis]
MNKPFFSIIMPIYNAESYLVEALDAVFVQTLQDFELIAVDDGSHDSSVAIVK